MGHLEISIYLDTRAESQAIEPKFVDLIWEFIYLKLQYLNIILQGKDTRTHIFTEYIREGSLTSLILLESPTLLNARL